MEQKMIRLPFNLEMARLISKGEKDGRIIDTYYNCNVRIVDFNFKTVQGNFCIGVSEVAENQEVYAIIDKDGYIFASDTGKKDDEATIMLEVPEYTRFKDGDVLSSGNDVFILKRIVNDGRIEFYACSYMSSLLFDTDVAGDNIVKFIRFTSEEEKQRLIDALKKSTDPRAKDCLKILGIEKEKPKYEFYFRQLVLIRDATHEKWGIAEFAYKDDDVAFKYHVIGGTGWNYCIPYEGNEHLLGTTQNP